MQTLKMNPAQIDRLQELDLDDTMEFSQELDGNRLNIRVHTSRIPNVQDPHDLVVDVGGQIHAVPSADLVVVDGEARLEREGPRFAVGDLVQLRSGTPGSITAVIEKEDGYSYRFRARAIKTPFGPDPVHEERELCHAV